MNWRKKVKKNKVLQNLSSLKITVVCLVLLFILTFWGTIAQVSNGLYLAQDRYFQSLFFLVFGFIPFPGAQMVMWVLFVNLIATTLTRFEFSVRKLGILTIHGGLILFLVSGFISLKCIQESQLTLGEGQARNVSAAYHDWELAVWENKAEKNGTVIRHITAVDIAKLSKNTPVSFEEKGFSILLKEYHRNSIAYTVNKEGDVYRNASGIKSLRPAALEKEPQKNRPGIVIDVMVEGEEPFGVLLYGSERQPTTIKTSKGSFNLIVRLKHYPLPFSVKLKDFMMERHPGTDTARAYKSRVAISTGDAWREKLIFMNNPLRHKDFTFYQASYSIDNFGNEFSTLAVVENSGRIMPYVATLITFLGLVIHFFVMGSLSRKIRTTK